MSKIKFYTSNQSYNTKLGKKSYTVVHKYTSTQDLHYYTDKEKEDIKKDAIAYYLSQNGNVLGTRLFEHLKNKYPYLKIWLVYQILREIKQYNINQ